MTTLACAAVVSSIVLGKGYNYAGIDASTPTNSITLDANAPLTTAEKDAQEFTRLTKAGNQIKFKTYGGGSFIPAGDNFARASGTNGWFYNTTPLNGLESFQIACSAKAFRVYFFNTAVDSDRMNYVAYEDGVGAGGSTTVTITVPKFEDPIKYIMWQAREDANNWVKKVAFTYSCSSSLESRGDQFTPSGVGKDIEPVDVATGTVNVDVKWTDLGADNGKTAMCLFAAGWGANFGYKDIYANTKTGDIPGLSVVKLSDGYTRFSWKLSEMEGGSPESIGVVHIRKDWTTSTGYFDCQSNVKVLERYGERFTEGVNYSFNYSEITLAGMKAELDILFDSDMGSSNNVNFYIADSSSCNKCYGNFSITYKGLVDSYNGVTFEKLSTGYCRVTLDIDSLTRTSGSGAPTTSIYSYLRGNWSHANGLVSLRFFAK